MKNIILLAVIYTAAYGSDIKHSIVSDWWTDIDEFNVHNWAYDSNEDRSENDIDNNRVCMTPGCQKMGKELLSSMKKSSDPCNDFHEYVCGGWNDTNPMPPYLSSWGRIMMYQNVVYKRIKGILEEKITRNDIHPVKQAKKWYRSCMNKEALEKRGLQQLESILVRCGGWPMIIDKEEWDEDDNKWQKVEERYFHLTRSYVFYKIKPCEYEGPGGELHLSISPGDLPLARKLPVKYRNYTGEDYNAYETLVENVARMFIAHNKADISENTLKMDVKDLVEFEKQLFMISDNGKYESYEHYSIDEFKKQYSSNLTQFLNTIHDSDNDDGNNENKNYNDDDDDENKSFKLNFDQLLSQMLDIVSVSYNDKLKIRVSIEKYFPKLFELMLKTSKRTIVNYIHWHFVSNVLDYGTDNMRNMIFSLMETEFGVTKRPPRWIECIRETKMIDALAYGFMKKYYTEETDVKIQRIVENLRASMHTVISNSNVLDEDTRKQMIEKLDTMTFAIGFPDWYKNKSVIIQIYRGLTIGSEYMENILSYRRFMAKKNMLEFIDPDDIYLSNEFAIAVNAGYGGNSVELPAVTFQPPLLTPQMPDFVNYGIIGCILGHEIGHGYDTREFRYSEIDDEDTRMRLTNATLKKYYDKAKCFADQFNKMHNNSEMLKNEMGESIGYSTLGENLADATGIQSAFIAYKNLMKNRVKEMKLPGFEEYTDEQMYFISFASNFCESMTEKYAAKQMRLDVHSSGRIRIIGGVTNSEKFAKAFNCPKGSPMNPVHKCNLWKESSESVKKLPFRQHIYPNIIYN